MEALFEIGGKYGSVSETDGYRFHDRFELLLVRGGQGSLVLDGELLPLSRGALVLIPPGALHLAAPLPKEAFRRTVVRFDPARLADYSSGQTPLAGLFSEEKRFLLLPEEETAEIEKLLGRCETKDACFGGDLRRNMAFLELLVRTGELLASGRFANGQAAISRERKRMEPLTAFIREHPERSLSLEAVAEEFHYNKNYLSRVFKGATGISVGDYITAVRISEAAGCLSRGMGVRESGEAAGFRNNSNYISTFHRLMGLSPGQYRQRVRAKAGGRSAGL